MSANKPNGTRMNVNTLFKTRQCGERKQQLTIIRGLLYGSSILPVSCVLRSSLLLMAEVSLSNSFKNILC